MTDPAALDALDPLRGFRDRFKIPPGLIYLDGNSLGPLPLATSERVTATVEQEWGVGLIRSWNDAGWITAAERIGDKIARIIGAGPGEVVVCDSTSINLFKLLAAGMQLLDDRHVVLTQEGNFPTDLYVAGGVVEILGGDRRVVAVPKDELLSKLDEDVAILCLTQVDYRSGELLDLESVTSAAHAVERWGCVISLTPRGPYLLILAPQEPTWRWVAPTSTSTAALAHRLTYSSARTFSLG